MAQDNGRKVTRQLQAMSKNISAVLPRAVLRGGTVIETEAKKKIVDKGHVVTGTLLRSINTQIDKQTRTSAESVTGSPVHYAKFVEDLPDGGFLFEASEEKLPEALKVAGDTIEEAMRESV